MSKIAVVAFEGSVLLKASRLGFLNEQIRNSDELCRGMLPILEHGYEMVVVYGIDPQVGNVMTQVEESITKIPPVTLDVCVAEAQGWTAYLLEKSLRKQLMMRGISKEIAAIVTQVVINSQDSSFRNPRKIIGPLFSEYRAQELMRRSRWIMAEDGDLGFHRVVASPVPLEIIPCNVVRRLVREGCIVIAGGGGGIPVARDDQGFLHGLEAVLDNNLVASLMAGEIGAKFLLMLTEFDQVLVNLGKDCRQPILEISLEEAERYLQEDSLASGNMKLKVVAAADFIKRGGHEVLITSARKLQSALMGRTGTRIFHRQRRLEKTHWQQDLPFAKLMDS
jgi:carbamate kinase